MWTCIRQQFEPQVEQTIDANNTGCNPFPFSDFRHFLTLFSKFFPSFPHGTCSLSVSRPYLALEGIYLPIWAAVPSNSTRRKRTVRKETLSQDGIITLSDALFLKDLSQGSILVAASIDYNSVRTRRTDFHYELLPLHSPLLGESLLVSFPPLNYMLKFSGYSFLIWGPIGVKSSMKVLVNVYHT